MSEAPRKRPCASCPYRRDVASGVWAQEEYVKLPEWDKPTGEQPPAIFECHQQDGHICAGWAGTHDMSRCLGLRIALSYDFMTEEDFNTTLEYQTDVPLFGSGAEAAAHGMADIENPSPKAKETVGKIVKKRTASA